VETIERSDLERMRDWAHEKVASSAEPAWSWYQHMKLRETLDAILSGIDGAIALKRPPAETGAAAGRLALVAETAQKSRGHARPILLS
jgi:hypothetical protein